MNRVLIVDDEPSILTVTAEMVHRVGFTPLTARSASEALKVFTKQHSGIVITDLRLGGDMDGVALCSRIQYDDKSVIVIAMSGLFNEFDKTYCLSVGFGDFLTKPVAIAEMSSALQCALDRRTRWMQIP